MDCEFRVGQSLRFVVNGVGQEDVVITFAEADTVGEYVASVVPLHGCIVVKPTRRAGAATPDSVKMFAFVSPKTGKVYHTWATCLSATRPLTRAESTADVKAPAATDAKAVVKPPFRD